MFFFQKGPNTVCKFVMSDFVIKTFITRNLDSIQIFIAGPFQK